MRRSHVLGVGMLSLALLSPALPSSHADAADARLEAAELLFRQGISQMSQRQFALAKKSFEDSQRIDPDVSTLVKLSDCEVELADFVSARQHLEQAVYLARARKSKLTAAVEKRFESLDAKVARVVLRFEGPAIPGRRVLRDGVEVDSLSLDRPLFFNPGKYVLTVTAPDYLPRSFAVSADLDGKRVELVIPPLEPVVKLPPKPDPQPEPSAVPATPSVSASAPSVPPVLTQREAGFPTRAVVGWSLAGAGAVALGFGSYFGLYARSKYSLANCPAGSCPSEDSLAVYNKAQSSARVSTWLFATGGTLALASLGAFLLIRDTGPVDVAVGPTEIRMVGRW